ncbi:MAG: methyltransferase [Sphingobacteriales bacterium]|nr:methyltransferase [Sphingobacteriales bacterium]MBI3718509.1 methyltransferase [Sphingobacteriales bacterium]
MAKNYFKFKQFTVQQEKAALKVSTDSCLFGAWIASQLQTINNKPQTILDIGTGTGLLMLMLAQISSALIDGIEIDKPSFEQAQENIAASPWKERLNLFNGDVKNFSFDKKYDFIISNPPFYEGNLKSVHQHINVAKHDAGLTLEELINTTDQNLTAEGSFAVLLPYHRTEEFISVVEKKNYYLAELVRVKQSFKHKYFRSILLFSRKQCDKKESLIIIREADDAYSPKFISLLKDYYLFL